MGRGKPGIHWTISEQVVDLLERASGDDEALRAAVDQVAEDGLFLHACPSQQAWDPILCALDQGDGRRRGGRCWPAAGVVLGERTLTVGDDAGLVTLTSPSGAAEVAAYLDALDEQAFAARYAAMARPDRGPGHGAQERDDAWSVLGRIADLMRTAAACERHVVFAVWY